MSKTVEPCVQCAGTGLTAHVKRKIGDADDPADHQLVELCTFCGGSGTRAYVRPINVEEKKPQ